MKKIKVEVEQDHLERLVQRATPLEAVAELVWNAVDGDASRIDVHVKENNIGGVESVTVVDDGHGIPHGEAVEAFKRLGASWKRDQRTSPGGRLYHGEKGEGRFKAFAIGSRVEWITRWKEGDQTRKYSIVGKCDDLGTFELGSPETVKERRTGTEVQATNVDRSLPSLLDDQAPLRLAEVFAVYLRRYPSILIRFNNTRVDPAAVQDFAADYPLEGLVASDGAPITAEVTIIEWKHRVVREMVLCDDVGCALATRKVGIHAKGFNFTAYLKSGFLRQHQAILDLDELHPELTKVLDAAREVLRLHFRNRLAEQARSLVDQWKEEKVYPYEGNPVGPLEQIERQMFEVVALNVNEYLPNFAEADSKSKRFSFQMLKTAMEQSPGEVRRVIQEVLELPQDKLEELAELLERTTLSSIINASRTVVNRLDFLAGLEVLLYQFEAKKKTRERKHLHRLLAKNTWIFGEEYHLAVDDQSLNEVLRRHSAILGRDPTDDLAPVTDLDGKSGIVDLMLSKQIALPKKDEFDHLVVELKRPSKKVDQEVVQQIERYAFAVARDERFRSSRVRWTFWAIGDELDAYAEMRARQANAPRGQIFQGDEPHVSIWAMTWNQVLDECKGRMRYFRDRLGYMATQESGVEHLQKVYSKYLPDVLKTSPTNVAPSATPPAAE